MNEPRGLEALLLGVSDCAVEGYQVSATCPGMRALAAARKGGVDVTTGEVGKKLLGNAAPAVRIEAAALLGAAGELGAIVQAGLTEKDAGVLQAFVHETAKHAPGPDAGPLYLAAADHAAPAVRLEAIAALAATPGIAGGAAKLVALAESDRDHTVRASACRLGGKLGDAAFLPLYQRISPADGEVYTACMDGLVAMFHDHPNYSTANEAAYRLFLERISATPRTATTPPWNIMSTFCYFTHESDPVKLAAWRQRATWFDANEVKKAITNVVADRAASWEARTAGVESLVGLGATEAEFTALQGRLDAKDASDKKVLEKLAGVH